MSLSSAKQKRKKKVKAKRSGKCLPLSMLKEKPWPPKKKSKKKPKQNGKRGRRPKVDGPIHIEYDTSSKKNKTSDVFIYQLTAKSDPDHVFYVGQTVSPPHRYREHAYLPHKNRKLHKEIEGMKARRDLLIMVIIDIVPKLDADRREQDEIAKYPFAHNVMVGHLGGNGDWVNKYNLL